LFFSANVLGGFVKNITILPMKAKAAEAINAIL
jgi:hypothetical protein